MILNLSQTFMWLPLLLLDAIVVYAQTSQQLSINAIASFNASTPSSLIVPAAKQLTVSIALCAAGSPRFFVTNSSTTNVPSSAGGRDVFEITLTDGQGNFTGAFDGGGLVAVENANLLPFEVGVSDGRALHQLVSEPPLLGDTTANQAILFSRSLAPSNFVEPQYPNYTLPQANLTAPTPPNLPNLTVSIFSTSQSTSSLPRTACAIRSQQAQGNIGSQTPWLKDESGWRQQWIMDGLIPATNYTAFVVQDNTEVSGPITFATKSATFACPLVASLPFCPGIAYPVPLPAPPSPAIAYDASTLPVSITQPLISSLTNFTTSLLTFACGRDWYSPLVSCADCQKAYRKWLCAVSFPRCGEASPSSPNAFTRSVAEPSATGIQVEMDGQQVLSALVPQPTSAPGRNPNFPQLDTGYTMLLPCLETCNAVDRACPNFLGFQCPVRRFNAAASYGVGYIDSGGDHGRPGGGLTGVAQDRWGNIWCNAG